MVRKKWFLGEERVKFVKKLAREIKYKTNNELVKSGIYRMDEEDIEKSLYKILNKRGVGNAFNMIIGQNRKLRDEIKKEFYDTIKK